MRQRVGHVLVTCTLATFGGGCTATSQVFNSNNGIEFCSSEKRLHRNCYYIVRLKSVQHSLSP